MQLTTSWHVEVLRCEDGRPAQAALQTALEQSFVATESPAATQTDTAVPEIGEELATSQAQSGDAHVLHEASVADIEQNMHRSVHLES